MTLPDAPTPDPFGAPSGGPPVVRPTGSVAPVGPPGKLRGTGVSILLTVVTFGIYPLFWYYGVHAELKRHRGTGLGGGIALVLAIFVGIAMPFLTSSEVGEAYERSGQRKPVSGLTGLWYFPGFLLLGIGPIVWFVKTNGALNAYWRQQGVTAS